MKLLIALLSLVFAWFGMGAETADDYVKEYMIQDEMSWITDYYEPAEWSKQTEAYVESETEVWIEPETEVWFEPEVQGNRWGIYPDDDEMYYLACVLWLEARGEPNAGQQAVVEVVFNRVVHSEFAGSVTDVLAEPGQFEVWGYWYNAEPTDKEYANIQAVVDGGTWWTDWNTVYFATRPIGAYVYDIIGNHYFCNIY